MHPPLVSAALLTAGVLAAQSSLPTSPQPIPQSPAAGNAAPGSTPGTERWVVCFETRPFTLAAYRAEMWGRRDPENAGRIVEELERKMRAHQAPFVAAVEALGGTVLQQFWLVDACCFEIAPRHLDALRTLDNVASLQPDAIVFPDIKTATNAANHNADALQAQGFAGAGVAAAVIDTGHDVDMNGTGQIHVAYSTRGDRTQSRLCVQRQIGSQPFDDVHGHGTGIASIVAGWRWNTATADHGHAYDARIAGYSIANAPDGSSTVATEAAAYQAVAADAAKCGIVATNLSFTGRQSPLSIEQMAMDSLALNADIVNCTSAGNLGLDVSRSLANVNGISVGACAENTMVLASFSSRGSQLSRYFPNMCANGVDTNMARRDAEGTDWVASGTSMSSPMVCGAVTQIRALNRQLKSDETRAVMLASAFPSPGTLDTIKAIGPGAGYLKNDVARDIALDPTRHGRWRLNDTTKRRLERTIRVAQGQTVQCAVAWHRGDVTSQTWNDLNLLLRRGSTILVNSNSWFNTEELVRYTAETSETLTMEVFVWGLHVGPHQEFAWACNLPTTGPDTLGEYATYGQGCRGSNGIPALSSDDWPEIGEPFRLTLRQARPNAGTVLWLGFRTSQSLFGCTLLATPEVMAAAPVADLGGTASVTLQIPVLSELLSQSFANQWWVTDPQGALLNVLALSNGGEGVIGG